MARLFDVSWFLVVVGLVGWLAWGDPHPSATGACGDGCTTSACISPVMGCYMLAIACPRIRRVDPPNTKEEGPGGFMNKRKSATCSTLCGQVGDTIGTGAGCMSMELEWSALLVPCAASCDDT